jgi:hypothetical protein
VKRRRSSSNLLTDVFAQQKGSDPLPLCLVSLMSHCVQGSDPVCWAKPLTDTIIEHPMAFRRGVFFWVAPVRPENQMGPVVDSGSVSINSRFFRFLGEIRVPLLKSSQQWYFDSCATADEDDQQWHTSTHHYFQTDPLSSSPILNQQIYFHSLVTETVSPAWLSETLNSFDLRGMESCHGQ